MLVGDLAVDELEAKAAEMRERNLGSIRYRAEHGLTEKHSSDAYTVETAGKRTPTPAFYRMGVPKVVQT